VPNVNYTEYDLSTGRILRFASCSSSKLPNVMPGEGRLMVRSDPKTQIVVDGEVVPKHTFAVNAARNGNDITLANVPEGTIITVENEQFVMDDTGEFELELDQPIEVTFTLSHDLYETKVIHVES
jgi:hypothetical protein